MYSLPYFKDADQANVLGFMRKHPFAFIAGCTVDLQPVATQIPVFIDERNNKLYLSGHIMRNTDHHKAFAQNGAVLAVFTGPQTYVSASWYSDKSQASTWNYMSVHAKGRLRFLEEEALLRVLQRTTDHFENNPYSGSNFSDLSPEYISKLVNAIVAFEVEVEKIDHVFKLSQNRDEKSYHNIIEQLDHQDADGRYISEEMKKRTSQLFKEK